MTVGAHKIRLTAEKGPKPTPQEEIEEIVNPEVAQGQATEEAEC